MVEIADPPDPEANRHRRVSTWIQECRQVGEETLRRCSVRFRFREWRRAINDQSGRPTSREDGRLSSRDDSREYRGYTPPRIYDRF
jgi:hypothetical protein